MQATEGLLEARLVSGFHLSIASVQGNIWHTLSQLRCFTEIARRTYPNELAPFLHLHPWPEIARLIASRLGLHSLTRHETGIFSVDAVYRSFDRQVARDLLKFARHSSLDTRHLPLPTAVYCYEDGALETFRTAKSLGLTCIYDLPIGYWRAARQIQTEEAQLRPGWAATMPALIDSEAKLARKDEELQLADQILVASSFTRKTLEEVPFSIAPVTVIPYGAPEVPDGHSGSKESRARGNGSGQSPQLTTNNHPSRHSRMTTADQPTTRGAPLRVLFAGSLSQRKGIADLLDAMKLMGDKVTLTLIGARVGPCKPLDDALNRTRWLPSVPHETMLAEMRSHDVFVFPSLFEGFGLVITEALSQGIPVITTPNTCGPDILTDGVDGFLVPIRDPQAIAEKLEILHHDRDRLAAMKHAAIRKAREVTWEAYRARLVEAVAPIFQMQNVE